MELLTKQGLQLTFLKVNVKAYFLEAVNCLALVFTSKKQTNKQKIPQGINNISQPILTNIISVLSLACFLPGHTILSIQNSKGI